MADNLRATPRNVIPGLFSDIVQGAYDFGSKPFGYSNPPAQMIMNALGVPDVAATLNRMSYGEPQFTGSGMTLKPREEMINAAMAVAPFAPKVGGFAARGAGEALNAAMMGENRGLLGKIVPRPLMAKEPSMIFPSEVGSLEATLAQQKIDRAVEKLKKSEDFKKLKGSQKDEAIASIESKINKTGVARDRETLMDLTGGEKDIVNSLLNNNAYKISGVIPQSTIDAAAQTRARFRAEPPKTPGANASEEEWKNWGDKFGVNMTVTPPESLGITDLTSKREVMIPGGLEGTFTIPDMFWMKANNIDPASLPKDVHDQLMQKLIRTHRVENPDQVDMFNRLNFALLSPNAPLTPNEFLAQRMRLTNMDELKALGGRVNEENLAQNAIAQTGVQGSGKGGMGTLGTANLGNQAMLAKLILDKPEMFQIAPGETMRDVTTRVMNQAPGLGPKTASLGTPWLDLNRANTSAVDLHMIRNAYPRLLDDPVVGEAFRTRMANKLGVDPTKEAILSLPEKKVEDAAIDVVGGTSLSRMYRTKGELNAIPASATPEKLAYEPKQFQEFNPFYNRVVDYVDESRGTNPVLELFPEQWRKWDIFRQRLEPHEFAHPDYRFLPRQSFNEMQDALTAHKQAGYAQSENKTMNPSDWRKLYYGNIDPMLSGAIAGGVGGGLAVNKYANERPLVDNTPTNPFYQDPFGNPFAETIR